MQIIHIRQMPMSVTASIAISYRSMAENRSRYMLVCWRLKRRCDKCTSYNKQLFQVTNGPRLGPKSTFIYTYILRATFDPIWSNSFSLRSQSTMPLLVCTYTQISTALSGYPYITLHSVLLVPGNLPHLSDTCSGFRISHIIVMAFVFLSEYKKKRRRIAIKKRIKNRT